MVEKLGVTPGPWIVDTKDGGIITQNQGVPAVRHSSSWIEDAWCGNAATDESKANDRLIAAAPELFEALYSVVAPKVVSIDEIMEVRIRAIVAMEKATGKTWEEIKEILG